MSGPIDSLRQLYDHSIRPVYDRVANVADDVAGAASDVRHAVTEAAGDVRQAIDDRSDAPLAVDVANVGADVVKNDLAQGARIGLKLMTELRQRSPQDFVDWLAGPEGPSVESGTALVPGLQGGIGHVIDAAMSNPLIAGVAGRAFSFEYVPGKDFYTTNESGLQSYTGFHALYDKVGKLLGMDLKDKTMEFEANGREYKLELWKGSYGAGGAYGGEIGLYTRGAGERGPLGNLLEHIPGYYSSAKGGDQIKTTQTIYDTRTGKTFTNDGKGADDPDGRHFWNLAIRTDPGVRDEDIGQRGTLEFAGSGRNDAEARNVAEAAFAAMQEQGVPGVKLSDDHLTISYDWPPGS